jgi:hypothetical protein
MIAIGRLLVVESGKSLPPITLHVPMPPVLPPKVTEPIYTGPFLQMANAIQQAKEENVALCAAWDE